MIVLASLSASITASRSSGATRLDLLIHESCLTRQKDFSSKRGGVRSRFRVPLWNEFHVVEASAAAQRFA
jgi:hypothetical protein